MTLVHKPDLGIMVTYLHAKNKVNRKNDSKTMANIG